MTFTGRASEVLSRPRSERPDLGIERRADAADLALADALDAKRPDESASADGVGVVLV